MSVRLALPAVLLGFVIASAAAQTPARGDYMLTAANSSHRGLIHVDRASGTASTWMQPPAGTRMRNVRMDQFNNIGLLVLLPGSPGHFASMSPPNFLSTWTTLRAGGAPIDMTDGQDSSIVVAETGGRLHRYYRLNRYNTLITSALPPDLTGVVLDGDNGDYVVSTNSGFLLRVDPLSLRISTFASGLGATTDVDFDPRSGSFLVGSSTGLWLVSKSGTRSSFALTNVGAVRVDPAIGHFHATSGDRIVQFARNGSVVRSHRVPGYRFDSLELSGYALAVGGGVARAGQSFYIQYRFGAANRGRPYFTALSYSGLRPGISLGAGRTISLAVDPLFNLTATNGDIAGTTFGLRGTVSQNSYAAARIRLPQTLPIGYRLFAAGLVFTPNEPGGYLVTNTVGFSLRPFGTP